MRLFTVQTSEPQVTAAPVPDDERHAGCTMAALMSMQQATTRVSPTPSALPSTSDSPTEDGTPFYHGPDDIPIDPALHAPSVDPALLAPELETNNGIKVCVVVIVH
jgi:hypothetical protein